jgi:hypothetical protein
MTISRRPTRDYFETLIPDQKELDSFGKWAFGEDLFELEHSIKFLEAWNGIHGDTMTLKPETAIGVDAPKMIQLWRNSFLNLNK